MIMKIMNLDLILFGHKLSWKLTLTLMFIEKQNAFSSYRQATAFTRLISKHHTALVFDESILIN